MEAGLSLIDDLEHVRRDCKRDCVLPPHRTRFEYDAVNRLTAKTTAQHRTEYHYGDRGVTVKKMPLAAWLSAQAQGREVTDFEVLSFTSDALGNLISTTLPDGRELSFLRYGTGHMVQMYLKHGGKLTEIAAYTVPASWRYSRTCGSRVSTWRGRRGFITICSGITTWWLEDLRSPIR
jgi:YD repeat-containing protein